MDPYLPGQIEMMVLRYLIVNKCDATALKLIEEMHNLKNFIPARPAKFSDTIYLKHLMMRLSATPVLKEELWDYGNSKILVDEMLYSEEEMFTSTESLVDKLQMVQEKFKNLGNGVSSVTTSFSQQQGIGKFASSPVVEKVDNFTNTTVVQKVDNSTSTTVVEKADNSTSTENYECPKCLASRLKLKTDSGCQTEEYTAVQFGLQNEIPVVFCETLLNDNTLQQKIAQTINQHMQDPQGEVNDISKISSKAVTEIDKFLVDFLKDLPDDSNSMQCDTGLFQNLGVASEVEIESNLNLSSMFGGNISPDENKSSSPNTPEQSHAPRTESSASQIVESQTTPVSSSLLPNTEAPMSSSNTSQVTPNSNECRNVNDSITPSSTASTPNRSQRPQPVKRITPTPLSNTHANPLFKESVLVEKKTVELGDKRAKMSVITRSIETPEWRKLNRRSIAPKIPGLTPQNHVPVVKHRDFGGVFKLGIDKRVPEQVVHPCSSPSSRFSANNKSGVSILSPMTEKSHPPSANKRKATPMKLSPEKANEKSFILYCPENNKPTSQQSTSKTSESGSFSTSKNIASNENRVNMGSNVKKTPASCSPAPNQSENLQGTGTSSKLVLSNENSQQHDVTPMQPPPPIETCSTSTLKTISPSALQRLIGTDNKIGAPATSFGNFCNKKKSFSTPRKRKHVRNLSFATPPSLKGATPGSEPPKGGLGTSQKRKASEDLFSAELRSKKRLNWPESEKKNNKNVSNPVGIISRRASDSIVSCSTTETQTENNQVRYSNHENRQDPVVVPSTSIIEYPTAAGVQSMQLMPTIAEESMSNMSVNISIVEPPETVVLPPNYQQGFNSTMSGPEQLYAVATTLSDGTTHLQYYQLSDDMRLLIPFEPPPVPDQSVSQVPQETAQSRNDSAPLATGSTTDNDIEHVCTVPTSLPNVSNLQSPFPTKNQERSFEPIGFPDPTPIKNFSDCLNISDVSCNMNGPLITPFKMVPPPAGLNETQFTLPPTPRVIIEDTDSNSNSNSAHGPLKFDPLYSLWTSTPLKPGVPRTPGRGSSSSNSQSPTLPGKTTGVILPTVNVEQNQACQHIQQPQLPAPLQTAQTFARPEPDIPKVTNTISSNAAKTATTALDLSSLPTSKKSDGEISSSDDEDHAKPRKNVVPIPQQQKSPPKKPSTSHHKQRQPPPVLQKSSSASPSPGSSQQQKHNRSLARPPPLHPLPHIAVSLSQNLKQTHGINFHVGGREKLLTMSEQETLYSLVSMGSIGTGNRKADVTRKENPPRSVGIQKSQQTTASTIPPKENEVTVFPPSTKNSPPVGQHNPVRKKGLDLNRLIKIVREKRK